MLRPICHRAMSMLLSPGFESEEAGATGGLKCHPLAGTPVVSSGKIESRKNQDFSHVQSRPKPPPCET